MTPPKTPTNLVLTGFMGSGKTTVGRLLSERLDMGFVDTDMLIEERHGRIADIFAEVGEAGFRDFEHEVALGLSSRSGLVIATGGRMLLDPDNLEALESHGLIVCLVAGPDELHRRVSSEQVVRPMLDGGDVRRRIEELLSEREAGYAVFLQIPTEGRSPEEVADEVARIWRSATAGYGGD